MSTSQLIFFFFFLGTSSLSFAAGGSSYPLERANTNIQDAASLQNGAHLFMNYCFGCHSLQYMRYNRLALDLDIPESVVQSHLLFGSVQIGDAMLVAHPEDGPEKWFGALPPDLSLTARSRGVDWIYTYLQSFYPREDRPFGVNNHLLQNVSMPDVLWPLRTKSTEAEFKKDVRDLTNFLDYVSEPAQLIRKQVGVKVIIFLLIMLVLTYLLKREYWRDIKYGKWKPRD